MPVSHGATTIAARHYQFGAHMKNTSALQGFLAAAALSFGVAAHATDITGAGATFPFPISAKWAEA